LGGGRGKAGQGRTNQNRKQKNGKGLPFRRGWEGVQQASGPIKEKREHTAQRRDLSIQKGGDRKTQEKKVNLQRRGHTIREKKGRNHRE